MPLPNYSGIIKQFNTLNSSLANITGLTYNAIFTIPQGSGEVVFDPVTGNYTVANTATISIQCKLVQKQDPLIASNTGVDQIRTYMVGHLVNPLFFNGAIPSKVPCQLKQNNIWTEGTFLFIDNIPTNINENVNLQGSIGQKIRGYFETQNTGV